MAILVAALPGLGAGFALADRAPATSFQSYKDVPGVTEDEITAIEALKESRTQLTYGVLFSTEAYTWPDGANAGFAEGLRQILSDLFGIKFVLEFYEWDELISNLDERVVDFTGELTRTESRTQRYGMTHPIAERMLRIFMHVDNDKIKTVSDVDGKLIAFLEGAITPQAIKKIYPVEVTVVEVADYPIAAEMLKNGEIDAFVDEAVADPAFDDYDFIRSEVFFPMVHEPVSLTTANPNLYPIISVVDKFLAAGNIDTLYALYHDCELEYSKYKLQKSLTDEEKAFIDVLNQRGRSIAVLYEQDNYPVNFYNDKDEEFQGIAIDVLAEISRLTGIRFTPASDKDAIWADIMSATESGEVHMIAELLQTEARQDRFIWSAIPYARSNYAIMSKADFPNLATYQVARHTVGVMTGSALEDIYHELFPENDNIVRFDTLVECLDALERGDIELLMASENMLLTQTHFREKSGFKINIKLNAPLYSFFGFYKDEAVLSSIVDKAQQYVDVDTVGTNWTGRKFDYSKKMAEDRMRYVGIFAIVVSVILIAAGFILLKFVKLSRKLKEMASLDVLTGIFNRRYFMELAAMQIERSRRTGIDSFAIIFDLDHFKSVNDTYGHQAGDKVLKEVAARVKKEIRAYDLLGRYGGEEFVILVSDIKPINEANAMNAMERIRANIAETPVEFEGTQIPITASFGVALAGPKNTLEEAIKFADEALYQAKATGRNKVIFNDASFGRNGDAAKTE